MKWQRAKELLSNRSHDAWKRASLVGLGGFLALRLVACATSDDSGAGMLPVQGNGGALPAAPFCGNGLVEVGETCDGVSTPTCGAATMGAKPIGTVGCNACEIDMSGCQSAGTGGASTGTGGSPMGTGASGGMVMGSGGTNMAPPGAGGTPGSGGTLGSGGTSPTGGQTASGGSTGASGSSGVLGDIDALRQTCVDTINMYRATKSLTPMKRATASVETCSDTGAQQDGTAMVAHGSAGKCPGMGAQDTCPGWPPGQYGGPAGALKSCLQSMWAEGEPPEGRTACINAYFAGNIACFEAHGHYLNMSDPANGTAACGFFVMSNGRLWMNQDFGR